MSNEAQREEWGDGAKGWVANEALFDAVLAPVTEAIVGAAGIASGERILDVGCGSGTLLAAVADAAADAVGADISEGMVEAARRRAPAATVLVADAQEADLLTLAPGSPFEGIVSRFGVMFFADPTAAFANIRRASAPGARLTFACWRTSEENPMFSLGTGVMLAQLDERPPPSQPGSPGPTAFADPDRTRGILEGAGWDEVELAPFDFTCDFGANGTDGVEERLTMILGTISGRKARRELEPRLGPDGWERLLDAVREELTGHLVDGAVRFPGATWLVTARNLGDHGG